VLRGQREAAFLVPCHEADSTVRPVRPGASFFTTYSTMFDLIAAVSQVAHTVYQFFFPDNEDHRPLQSHESQPPVRRRDERQHRQTIDSSQRDPTPLEAYATLRARAKQEGDLMAQYFQQSKEAYERRDRARAKLLSEEGKRHATKMEKLNAQASATIFKGKLVSIFSWLNVTDNCSQKTIR
jgi:hypothetical protein